ncbi:MAG: type II secretion system F family protein [Fibrobacteres bacterium]|nr:type II secretion system F family protein [Fibrobacterota bacterium]
MDYKYSGYMKDGKKVSGIISASDKSEAAKILRSRHLRIETIRTNKQLSFFKSVPVKDLSSFTRQFATLSAANLPIDESLSILAEQTENHRLKSAVDELLKQVRSGISLGDALSSCPTIFNNLYCGMVKAGEAAGVLSTVLERLADYLERMDKIQKKIKASLAYPVVVGAVAIIVIAALIVFVVPTFRDMFLEMGRELPLVTRIVLGLSDYLRQYIPFIAVLAVVLTALYNKSNISTKWQIRITEFKMKLPIVGKILINGAVARFSRTLSTLLQAGIPLMDSLKISKASSNNIVLEMGIERSMKSIEIGEPFSKPLSEVTMLPPMLVRMAAVGERTGELPAMLGKVADYYDSEINSSVDSIMSILEPLMILVLGIVIGFVLVSMYLPLFEMVTEVQ